MDNIPSDIKADVLNNLRNIYGVDLENLLEFSDWDIEITEPSKTLKTIAAETKRVLKDMERGSPVYSPFSQHFQSKNGRTKHHEVVREYRSQKTEFSEIVAGRYQNLFKLNKLSIYVKYFIDNTAYKGLAVIDAEELYKEIEALLANPVVGEEEESISSKLSYELCGPPYNFDDLMRRRRTPTVRLLLVPTNMAIASLRGEMIATAKVHQYPNFTQPEEGIIKTTVRWMGFLMAPFNNTGKNFMIKGKGRGGAFGPKRAVSASEANELLKEKGASEFRYEVVTPVQTGNQGTLTYPPSSSSVPNWVRRVWNFSAILPTVWFIISSIGYILLTLKIEEFVLGFIQANFGFAEGVLINVLIILIGFLRAATIPVIVAYNTGVVANYYNDGTKEAFKNAVSNSAAVSILVCSARIGYLVTNTGTAVSTTVGMALFHGVASMLVITKKNNLIRYLKKFDNAKTGDSARTQARAAGTKHVLTNNFYGQYVSSAAILLGVELLTIYLLKYDPATTNLWSDNMGDLDTGVIGGLGVFKKTGSINFFTYVIGSTIAGVQKGIFAFNNSKFESVGAPRVASLQATVKELNEEAYENFNRGVPLEFIIAHIEETSAKIASNEENQEEAKRILVPKIREIVGQIE